MHPERLDGVRDDDLIMLARHHRYRRDVLNFLLEAHLFDRVRGQQAHFVEVINLDHRVGLLENLCLALDSYPIVLSIEDSVLGALVNGLFLLFIMRHHSVSHLV